MIGALTFAFVAGAVATANPCGFALLPAYIARRLGTDSGENRGRTEAILRGFAVGAATTVGFVLIFGLIGGAVSLGAHWLGVALPWAGLVIGIVLAATGLAVLAGRHVGLNLSLSRPVAGESTLRGDFVFGVGYGACSLSCTLPIFLAATGTATTGGMVASGFSFVAYGLGMGTILTSLAIGAALSRHDLAAAIGRILPYVDRASGAILLMAGVYVAYYWGASLRSPDVLADDGVIAIGERVSSTLMGWLSDPTGQAVIYGMLAALAAVLVWALRRRPVSKARDRDWEAGTVGRAEG